MKQLAAFMGGFVLLLSVGCAGDKLDLHEVVLTVAAALVAIEVVFGATVVLLLMPLWIAIVHQATGILVFALLAAAYLRRHAEPASPTHA